MKIFDILNIGLNITSMNNEKHSMHLIFHIPW